MSRQVATRNEPKQADSYQSTQNQISSDDMELTSNEESVTSSKDAFVDDTILDVFFKSHLEAYTDKFIFAFNVRSFDDLSHVRDEDMLGIGIHLLQIEKLREQILKMTEKLITGRSSKQVFVVENQSTQNQNAFNGKDFVPNQKIKIYELCGSFSWAEVQRSNGHRIDIAFKNHRDISPNIMEDLRVEASRLLKQQSPVTGSQEHLHYGMAHHPTMMLYNICEGGSLLDRLRADKKPVPLVSKLHSYCIQIAMALQYLESRKLVYRCLSARNIVLDKDEETVLIGDFDLIHSLRNMTAIVNKDLYKFGWKSPESLRDREYSHASDVWSYGVTIWELFSYGQEPWEGCCAIDILKRIDAGERLEKPNFCSQKVYEIMHRCWKQNPAERCNIRTILDDLNSACFIDAVAREDYNSNQPGAITLDKGDEVVVVENSGQTWFGQNKTSRKFGSVPKSVFLTPEEKDEEYWNVFIWHGRQRPETTQPVIPKQEGQQPVPTRSEPTPPQQVKIPHPTTTTPPISSQVTRAPVPPAGENRKVPAPAPITDTATPSATSHETMGSTPIITVSEEARCSRTIQDVAATFPAPSTKLLGSNSNSTPTATTQTAMKNRPVATQVKPSQVEPTKAPKKIRGNVAGEPILSTEFRHPAPVPSIVSAVKPVSQPNPTQQPVRNPSPLVAQTRFEENKHAQTLAQRSNVSVSNISNTSMYPQLNSYPNNGSGHQSYGDGSDHNSGYPGIQRKNPFTSDMRQLALTSQAVNSLLPLVPSENRFSGSVQGMGESAINEFLGAQQRPEAIHVNPTPPPSVVVPSTLSSPHFINLNDPGSVDKFVAQCQKDSRLATTVIDLTKTLLMYMPVSDTKEHARQQI
ncbi:hypothetical protein B9Z55_022832 [Caenorhabditis nigoni]|nr:hypothetical protein B9Z55_022832 [Caenorhabditis nigoni]